MSNDWTPSPVPLLPADEHGRVPHDIGDDMRAAIVRRLIDDWSGDPDLSPEKARALAMWAGASVRALIYEIGVLGASQAIPAVAGTVEQGTAPQCAPNASSSSLSPALDAPADNFADWVPEFVVFVVVHKGTRRPKPFDSIWVDESTAQKRCALRGEDWRVERYSHIRPAGARPAPSSSPQDDTSRCAVCVRDGRSPSRLARRGV